MDDHDFFLISNAEHVQGQTKSISVSFYHFKENHVGQTIQYQCNFTIVRNIIMQCQGKFNINAFYHCQKYHTEPRQIQYQFFLPLPETTIGPRQIQYQCRFIPLTGISCRTKTIQCHLCKTETNSI